MWSRKRLPPSIPPPPPLSTDPRSFRVGKTGKQGGEEQLGNGEGRRFQSGGTTGGKGDNLIEQEAKEETEREAWGGKGRGGAHRRKPTAV